MRIAVAVLAGLLLAAPASAVTGGIVPASGHWIMEENPAATTKLVLDFLAK